MTILNLNLLILSNSVEKMKKDPDKYIAELEEKIVELSLKLRNSSNELKSKDQFNNKLIGQLIHNLKNPIGNVYSFSDIILESIDNYSPEKLKEYLNIINNSAAFSIKLLNDVALYIELKSPTFKNEKTDYLEILNNAISNFSETALKKNITIVKNFTNKPIYLNINADKILVAINKIISNALRFSNDNSKVIIEVIEHKNKVDTIISDEGIGISETDLFSIFNEFFVVNTYATDKQKCIGLGLPIAKKIIEYSGGEISIKSTINNGSQIKISLPIFKK